VESFNWPVCNQPRQIAERVQHGHHRHHRQQKGQHKTQTEAVVDAAQQHQDQQETQRQTLSGRHDEDAALRQHDRAVLDLRAEQPVAEALFGCGQHNGSPRVNGILASPHSRLDFYGGVFTVGDKMRDTQRH